MIFIVFIKHVVTKLLACCLRNVNFFATYTSTINIFGCMCTSNVEVLEISCLFASNYFLFFVY